MDDLSLSAPSDATARLIKREANMRQTADDAARLASIYNVDTGINKVDTNIANDGQDITRGKKAAPFAPGHSGGPGRGKQLVQKAPATPEEVRALLFQVLDKETAEKMVRSIRRKVGKGQLGMLEFLFDRMIGRPAVTVQVSASESLNQFIGAWQSLILEPHEPNMTPISDRSTVIEADYTALGDDPASESPEDEDDGAPDDDDEDSDEDD